MWECGLVDERLSVLRGEEMTKEIRPAADRQLVTEVQSEDSSEHILPQVTSLEGLKQSTESNLHKQQPYEKRILQREDLHYYHASQHR